MAYNSMSKLLMSALILLVLCSTALGATTIPAGSVSSYSLSSGEYRLAGNVTSTATAFVFNGNGVTFDGMGYTVTYATTSAGYAFLNTGREGCAIHNVTIRSGNDALTNCYAMYIYNTHDVDIYDVNSRSYRSYGLYLRNAEECNVLDNVIGSNIGTGMYLNGATHNTVNNNTIYSNTGYALFGDSSSENTYNRNYIYSNSSSAINLPATSHHSIFNFNRIWSGATNKPAINSVGSYSHTFQSNDIQAPNYIGVYMLNSTLTVGTRQWIFDNNTITTGAYQALYVHNSYLNTITDNTAYSSGSNGAYFRGARNNTVLRNNFTSGTNDGLLVAYGSYTNIFTDNIAGSTGMMGIFIFNASGNTFSGTTVVGPYASAPHATNDTLMVGDSITEGGQGGTVYSQLQTMFEDGMQAHYPWYVSNQGFSGERAWQGRERFTQELDVFDPLEVNIMYGTNDLLDGRSQQAIIDDVLWMAAQADARGIEPHVLLTPSMSANNNLRIMYDQNLSAQAIAAGYEVINMYDAIDAVPFNGVYDAHNATNFADGIHPNTAGNTLLARALIAEQFPLTPNDEINITSTVPVFQNVEILENYDHTFEIYTNEVAHNVNWYINGVLQETDLATDHATYAFNEPGGIYNLTAQATRGTETVTATWYVTAVYDPQGRTEQSLLQSIFGSISLVALIPMMMVGILIIAFMTGNKSGFDTSDIIETIILLFIMLLIVSTMAMSF